jgi:hypothetical protein
MTGCPRRIVGVRKMTRSMRAAAKRLRSSDDRLSYVAETISSVIGKLDDADPLAGPGVTADRADGDVSRRSGE